MTAEKRVHTEDHVRFVKAGGKFWLGRRDGACAYTSFLIMKGTSQHWGARLGMQ